MRCKNCGWPNRPGVTECSKCGAPISEEGPAPFGEGYDSIDNGRDGASNQSHAAITPANLPHLKATVAEGGMAGGGSFPDGDTGYPKMEFQPGKTVREDQVFSQLRLDARDERQDPLQELRRVPTEEARVCTKCGYPLREGSNKCPNCNYDPGNEQTHEQERKLTRRVDEAVQRRPTRMSASPGEEVEEKRQHRSVKTAAKKFDGTFNPYTMNYLPDPMFTLKPMVRINERHEPKEVELEGSEVVLTRDNTEPGNPSITSREQAVITNENDQWYIQDRSEQGTTFVRATGKIQLSDGDVILLGNRLFEFHTQ